MKIKCPDCHSPLQGQPEIYGYSFCCNACGYNVHQDFLGAQLGKAWHEPPGKSYDLRYGREKNFSFTAGNFAGLTTEEKRAGIASQNVIGNSKTYVCPSHDLRRALAELLHTSFNLVESATDDGEINAKTMALRDAYEQARVQANAILSAIIHQEYRLLPTEAGVRA